MNKIISILWILSCCLFCQTDTTLSIFGESNLFVGDSKNPELNWLSPNGDEIYESMSLVDLQWDGNDESFTNQSISIFFSQNLGQTFEAIAENIPNSETYSLTLPNINSGFARFKIKAVDFYGNQSEDFSDIYFTIGNPYIWDSENTGGQQEVTINIISESENFVGDSKSPEISWTYPNGNEQFEQGESIVLEWSGYDDTFGDESISIFFSENLGSVFDGITQNISNDSSVDLTLPEINSAFGRFKILAIDDYGNTSEDMSDLYFAIGNPSLNEGGGSSSSLTINISDESDSFIGDSKNPTIEWLYPNGGEQFDNYETITAEWLAEDESFGDESISIYLSKELGGYYESYNSENIPNLLNYDITLPQADEAFARFKVTAVDSFGNASEDYGDNYFVIGDPFGNYNVNPYDELVILDWGWAGYQLILVEQEALSFMDEGDQIHAVDYNGIISDECSDDIYGTVSVAQDTYSNNATNPYSLYSIEGYEDCSEAETAQAGYIAGNEAGFLHYDLSSDSYYELSPSFVSWSGIFGDSPQDTLAFKFYDASENKTYQVNETIPFTPDMIQGNAMFPNELTYNLESFETGLYDCDLNINSYEYNGSLTATLNDVEPGDRIASFVGGQCRGDTDAVQSPFDTVVFLLMNYGNPALSIIESFDQIAMRHQPNLASVTENRELYSFNIYRENEIIDEGISEYYYFDDDMLDEGEYCYEIALVDNEGNEMVISEDQCLEVELENEIILGDVNGDALVNVVDVVMMVEIILNGGGYTVQADLNQDGLFNVVDVVMLVEWILGG